MKFLYIMSVALLFGAKPSFSQQMDLSAYQRQPQKEKQYDGYFLATETLGGFTGMMFGLFAEGNEGTKAHASFSWFDYDGKDKKN